MRGRTIAIAAAAAACAVGAATGIAAAGGGDDEATEEAITGAALEQASTAALAHTGAGRVTGSEVGDEESYYEIEVTMPDGQEVDVQLDESFEVVVAEADSDDGPGDD
ncbi:MAG: PepSY domain-containing protein [Acidimicrobiia bacterium]